MSEHLRVMSNMIGKPKDAGHPLTDEQQVRAVIRSIPASWANMKQILTHSENIKNFSDVSQRVILEAETQNADKTLTYAAQEDSACKWQAWKTKKPFGKVGRATQPLEVVHSDICGPMSVKARHGASYFFTLIDDYTRYGYVYLISHRYNKALDCFKRFVAEVENQKEKILKTLRSD
ncbi:hypothetical protein RJ640_018326 [Escallonia rubra]|uniref:Integrase catalytic domain-containing protein n=1 Tax=Escallonia rubra TaxID=112253 RepID=A0AA88ULI3_9ASTE|nr:hypothetical protein RJ640_018326 [Escallonia rubra]